MHVLWVFLVWEEEREEGCEGGEAHRKTDLQGAFAGIRRGERGERQREQGGQAGCQGAEPQPLQPAAQRREECEPGEWAHADVRGAKSRNAARSSWATACAAAAASWGQRNQP